MTPDNPFAGSDSSIEADPRPGLPLNAGVGERFPVWTLGDVIKVAAIALVAIVAGLMAALLFAALLPAFRNISPLQLQTDPRIIVPGQMIGYVVLVGSMYRLISTHYHMNFAEAIRWNWPEYSWLGYFAGGAVLAMVIQGISRFLPVPKQMPIDQMFRNYSGVWVMAVFGVAIAPVVEELFFRGLLFPAMARRIGLFSGIVLTSLAFALLHASQLGKAWGPLLILFIVGLTLTIVRSRAKSVAASFLVHAGYNLCLFTLLYLATDGFRSLDKLAHP